MTNDEPIGNGWHLDKRVPIILILAILGQTAGAIWWASSISGRVTTLELAAVKDSTQEGRIVRNETLILELKGTANRIETKLDRLIERTGP